MKSNTIQDKIQQEREEDKKRLAEKYRKLYDLLDSVPIRKEDKEEIGEIVESIAYYSERQGLQRGVKEVNEALVSLYWSTRPTFSVNYWQHEQVKKYEETKA